MAATISRYRDVADNLLRHYDPDIGGSTVSAYRRVRADRVMLFTQDEIDLIARTTPDDLRAARQRARLKITHMLKRTEMDSTATLTAYETGGVRIPDAKLLLWLRVCDEAYDELQSWLKLPLNKARTKAGVSIESAAKSLRIPRRIVERLDAGEIITDAEWGLPDDIEIRWAVMCRDLAYAAEVDTAESWEQPVDGVTHDHVMKYAAGNIGVMETWGVENTYDPDVLMWWKTPHLNHIAVNHIRCTPRNKNTIHITLDELRSARRNAYLSQQELADLLDLDPHRNRGRGTIARWETGVTPIGTAVKIRWMNVCADALRAKHDSVMQHQDLHVARVMAGFTQGQLAALLGVPVKKIAMMEKENEQSITPSRLRMLWFTLCIAKINKRDGTSTYLD